jgi:hypothetical protein
MNANDAWRTGVAPCFHRGDNTFRQGRFLGLIRQELHCARTATGCALVKVGRGSFQQGVQR